MVKCPRCGVEVTELHPIGAELQEKLTAAGENSFDEVCSPCMSEFNKIVSRGGGLIVAQERAQEQQRQQLWKSRVQLIKKARGLMAQKHYSEAAMAYEKYLKILELVFQTKKGMALTPEVFKNNARTTELTVVASVYWDLLRIYDSSEKFGDRQKVAARQLAAFVRFTPIFPDILKRAQAFVKQSKNPDTVKLFIKSASASRPRCFVATAAFESPMAYEVQFLRFYRDQNLRGSVLGRAFIKFYYRFSPFWARVLNLNPWAKPLIRGLLRVLINCVG